MLIIIRHCIWNSDSIQSYVESCARFIVHTNPGANNDMKLISNTKRKKEYENTEGIVKIA